MPSIQVSYELLQARFYFDFLYVDEHVIKSDINSFAQIDCKSAIIIILTIKICFRDWSVNIRTVM